MAKKDKGNVGTGLDSVRAGPIKAERTPEQTAYEALGIKATDVFAQKWYDDKLVVVTRDGRKLIYRF